jgi:phenylalanine-4-hydroxylase
MPGSKRESIYEVEQIARLPRHLKQYIVDQTYERYTALDHAVWRFIMRQAVAFHRMNAHESYLEGLRKTGIGLERIPRIEEMNEILGAIGWGAAPVDGFIPPAAFMEFQAHRVLVIAADMRQVDHIEYTPAPDIVHEAAGHAPIIADEEYAEYLRRFGEYGAMAISSRRDHELYEAVRHLSIVKEALGSTAEEIHRAEADVSRAQADLGDPSEMALLTRLHWWTVEYGLIGALDRPKIYGAGLLSSIGEAAHCLTPAVEKLPYTIRAADYPFDITSYQPRLFVTESFSQLNAVLDEFADSMSFRRGGLAGLRRALDSAQVATFVYSSGLQVSGKLIEILEDSAGGAAYVRTGGPTALAFAGTELPGHGTADHAEGFGSPVGRPRGCERPLESLDDREMRKLGLEPGAAARLEFTSGVVVSGRLERVVRERAQVVLLTFSGCRVAWGDRVLFDPDWGTYDMAVGEGIVSVFQGAADKDAYEQVALVPKERTIRVHSTDEARDLHRLYGAVREVRETGEGRGALPGIYREARSSHPHEWLLPLEILEVLVAADLDPELRREIEHLLRERKDDPTRERLIDSGLELLLSR